MAKIYQFPSPPVAAWDAQRARELFEQGVSVEPFSPDRALKFYCAALARDPRYADAHLNLAGVYWETGERRKAISHYRRYLQYSSDAEPWRGVARSRIRLLLAQDPLRLVPAPTAS